MSAAFKNRWYIRGELHLDTDMYLGDGDAREEFRKTKDGDQESADVATVARDANGHPTIPGASLKGVLRSYLEDAGAKENDVNWIFGKAAESGVKDDDPDEQKRGHGGRLDVHYSSLNSKNMHSAMFVAIDRRTRTARDRSLFGADYVPRGSVFTLNMIGYDLEDRHVSLLLAGLKGFDHKSVRPLRLGSKHANQCGVATWKPLSIREVRAEHLQTWLQKGDFSLTGIGQERVTHIFPALVLAMPACLRLNLELHFHTPVLVPDPAYKKAKGKPDCLPRKTPDGQNALLPFSSIRGAFRSQAERIARTLDPNAGGEPSTKPDTKGRIERVFGYSGRRAWVEFSDFLSELKKTEDHICHREFVAIDRFTGGAAESLKFNADVYDPPGGAVFSGSITLDLTRLNMDDLGLFALTLRDLFEGDIAFGKGAAKGWGACTARVTSIAESSPGVLKTKFDSESPQATLPAVATPMFGLTSEVQSVLSAAVKEFQRKLGSNKK